VTTAFKIILSDANVEGILVNIFGGIMRCDVIAEGVVAAAREVALHVPLVVRLEGTNVELGKKILQAVGPHDHSADNLADAAEKIVKAVKEAADMAVLVDKKPRSSARASPARRARSIPSRRSPTAPRWSAASRPGKGGTKHLDLPVFDTVPSRRQTGADAASSTCRRPSRPTRSSRRSTPDRAGGVHHRGHPGPRHGRVKRALPAPQPR
jgi:hypothetical protein